MHIQRLVHVGVEKRRKTAVFVERKLGERLSRVDGVGNERAGDLVRVAEGHALFRQIVGAVGGVDKASVGRLTHVLRMNLHGVDHGGKHRQAQLDAAKKQAELEAQQQAFENTMKVIDAMKKAGASEEGILAYMQSNGLLGNNNGGSGMTNNNDNTAGGTSNGNVNTLVSALDQKTKDSAYYRGTYLAGKISAGKMTKWEAVNNIIATYQDNFPAMKVAAEKAGVMNELLSRYR